MKEILNGLNSVLYSQLECVAGLLELARQEAVALQDNDIHELSTVCGGMSEAAANLTELEEARLEIHGELTRRLDLPEEATLRAVLDRLTEGGVMYSGEICQTADSLSSAYRSLMEQNRINKMLVRQSISYVRAFFEFLGPERKLTYAEGGVLRKGAGFSSIVDRTV